MALSLLLMHYLNVCLIENCACKEIGPSRSIHWKGRWQRQEQSDQMQELTERSEETIIYSQHGKETRLKIRKIIKE